MLIPGGNGVLALATWGFPLLQPGGTKYTTFLFDLQWNAPLCSVAFTVYLLVFIKHFLFIIFDDGRQNSSRVAFFLPRHMTGIFLVFECSYDNFAVGLSVAMTTTMSHNFNVRQLDRFCSLGSGQRWQRAQTRQREEESDSEKRASLLKSVFFGYFQILRKMQIVAPSILFNSRIWTPAPLSGRFILSKAVVTVWSLCFPLSGNQSDCWLRKSNSRRDTCFMSFNIMCS